MGSPTWSISGMTHFRSKALARTILKIFWTLMEWEVEQKIWNVVSTFRRLCGDFVDNTGGGSATTVAGRSLNLVTQ